ncbi:MAG: AglZ/HisF2 family acetamidino modification protein [Acidobacteriota bacterium]
MLRTRVMPCLLLERGRLVKTVMFQQPSYVGDPINAVRIFNDKEVDDLLLLDIGASEHGLPIALDLIERIASECFMPITYGGGIRTTEQIRAVLAVGVEKVALNRMAFDNPSLVTLAAEQFGSQSIVVSMDVRQSLLRGHEVYVDRGRRATGADPAAYAARMQRLGAGEILLNSITRDGTMKGYDVHLIQKVSKAITLPLIVCGGAGRVEHFADAVAHGATAVAAGSMVVYQGPQRGVLISFPPREELVRAILPVEKIAGESDPTNSGNAL